MIIKRRSFLRLLRYVPHVFMGHYQIARARYEGDTYVKEPSSRRVVLHIAVTLTWAFIRSAFPLTVRRDKLNPAALNYRWHDYCFLTLAPNYIIFNSDGLHILILHFIKYRLRILRVSYDYRIKLSS